MRSSDFLVLLVLAVACGGDARAPGSAAADGVAAAAHTMPQAPLHAVHPFADLNADQGAAIGRAMADDRGIAYSARDMVVRTAADARAPVAARVRFYPLADGGYTDTLFATGENVYGQLTRASHDDYGLPADTVMGDWARVIYGYTADGAEQKGWLELVRDSIGYVSYDSLLTTYDTWFTDPAAIAFYEQPNGRQVQFTLDPSYSLKVLDVLGPWLRVRVAVPDTTSCSGDETAIVQRRATWWVPRINRTGNRQVWAAVAGC